MNLSTDIVRVKGVGEKIGQQFYQAGIKTIGDLISFLPRKHEDFSNIIKISQIKPGKVTIKAKCQKISTRIVRRGLKVTTATLSDGTDKIQAVWFNQPYRETQLKDSAEFYFSGEYQFSYNRYQLNNPSVEKADSFNVQTGRILPIYRAISGLKSNIVRKIIAELKPLVLSLKETLPVEIIESEEVVAYHQAIFNMHFPESQKDIVQARQRLAFEEMFHLVLASQLNKQANSQLKGYPVAFNQELVKHFINQLPFKLTDAQRRAAWQIILDMEKDSPMNRLLQGDVGSGKTVVAGLVACQAAKAGFQTALMAPTELLAKQHAETISSLTADLGITVGLLTGSVKGEARKILYENIRDNQVSIIIGTHALIQKNLEFDKLGLVIIDEQHRFGVKQRQQLLVKSILMPHLLTMTATPIPRSLQLTLFGELDISLINELPKNRLPIITKICSPNSRQPMYDQIEAELKRGRQAYFICRLIDQDEGGRKSVSAEYDKLRQIFKHRKIAMLHGRMKPQEKDQVMKQFLDGDYDILVSTTVIEVGVDVPNATVMVIEEADQFGLSQLHQLRGRVGRGQYQSYCYLVNSTSLKPTERLKQLEISNDGFYLAEMDLKLRGPGEIYGLAQHGLVNLEIASLSDLKLMRRAEKAAKIFINNGYNLLQYKQLADKVEYYQRLTTLN